MPVYFKFVKYFSQRIDYQAILIKQIVQLIIKIFHCLFQKIDKVYIYIKVFSFNNSSFIIKILLNKKYWNKKFHVKLNK